MQEFNETHETHEGTDAQCTLVPLSCHLLLMQPASLAALQPQALSDMLLLTQNLLTLPVELIANCLILQSLNIIVIREC